MKSPGEIHRGFFISYNVKCYSSAADAKMYADIVCVAALVAPVNGASKKNPANRTVVP